MSESVYKVIEVVGTSKESWEQAATIAMMTAAKTLRDIRVGEVVSADLHLDGEAIVYRTRIKVSFRYHDDA
ncbi:MAG: dodecin family protein [Oscillochloridaceae bacterium umkhey_bin13]